MFGATMAGLIVAVGGSPTTGIVFGLLWATASSPVVAQGGYNTASRRRGARRLSALPALRPEMRQLPDHATTIRYLTISSVSSGHVPLGVYDPTRPHQEPPAAQRRRRAERAEISTKRGWGR
jgi:hypothetical protein